MNSVTTILSIKLGSCVGMPKSRLHKLLQAAAEDANRARNAALRHWIRWREDHPDYQPEPKRKKDGSIVTDAEGKPRLGTDWISNDCTNGMYRAAMQQSRLVNGTICSACTQQVRAKLGARMPYNYQGDHKKFHQAVAAFDVTAPTWRGCSLPVANSTARIAYCGQVNKSGPSEKMEQFLKERSASTCLLYWPLLSKTSGYYRKALLIHLEVGDLSVGHRRWLQRLIRGELKMSDSLITEKDGKWYLRLVLKIPREAIESDVAVEFGPGKPTDREPFVLTFPDGGSRRMGFGRQFAREVAASIARRKALGVRYSKGANSGRGRGGFYRATRPVTRRINDLAATIRKKMAADIVSAALRNQAGLIIYHEPDLFLRKKTWYAERGLNWAWDAFAAQLQHAADRAGLRLEVRPLKWKEVKETWAKQSTSTPVEVVGNRCHTTGNGTSRSSSGNGNRSAETVSGSGASGKVPAKRRGPLAKRKS